MFGNVYSFSFDLNELKLFSSNLDLSVDEGNNQDPFYPMVFKEFKLNS